MTELFSDVSRETQGAHRALYARRCFMALFAAVAVLGLLNAFGQEASTSTARASGVSLTLSAPERVRGGLFFQSRVEIRARRRIAHPNLVLDHGWTEGMQVNSIEPAPPTELSRDGHVVLGYDALQPGDLLRVWLQFEVDPTSIGRRPYDLALDDGTTELARVSRHIRVLP
jgi:hypothetical protein